MEIQERADEEDEIHCSGISDRGEVGNRWNMVRWFKDLDLPFAFCML